MAPSLVRIPLALPKGGRPPIAPIIRACQKICTNGARGPRLEGQLGIGVAVGGHGRYQSRLNRCDESCPHRSGSLPTRRRNLAARIRSAGSALIITHELCWSGTAGFGKGRGAAQFAVIYTGEVLGGAFYFDGTVCTAGAGRGREAS